MQALMKSGGFYNRIRKLHRLGVALGLFVLGLSTSAETALEIMAEDDAAPWSQADGSGAANDIVKASFAAAGVDIVLRTVPYARCKHMVLTGQIAACFSMSADASLGDKVVFADQPIYRVYTQYFHNPQHPLSAHNEAEISRGAVVGIVNGYEYPTSVTALAQRGIVLEAAGSEKANLKKLAAGRLDAAVAQLDEFKSVEYLTQEAHVEGLVQPVFRASQLGSYIGFSTQHAQGLWARDRFNEGFAKIRSNGTLQTIMAKWRAQTSH